MCINKEFLDKFKTLEGIIGRIENPKHQSFVHKLRKISCNSYVKQHLKEIEFMAQIRNLLSHHMEIKPSIQALPELISKLNLIIRNLELPPLLVNYASKVSKIYNPDDKIDCIISDLIDNQFSNALIKDYNNRYRLLTPNTIMRWIGKNIKDNNGFSFNSKQANEVLKNCEYGDNEIYFYDETLTIFDALREFENIENPHLDVIVITKNGLDNESPIYIVTRDDIPKLYKGLDANE